MRQTQKVARLLFNANRMFSTSQTPPPPKHGVDFDRKPDETSKHAAPKYDPLEYEHMKYADERNTYYSGYTAQELWGKKYGLKHSEDVKNEIRKDSIFAVFFIVSVMYFVIGARDKWIEEQEAFKTYLYHDMNFIRPPMQGKDLNEQ